MVETYKDSYEEAIEHVKEMGEWDKERVKMVKEL